MKHLVAIIIMTGLVGACTLPDRSPQPDPHNGWNVIAEHGGGCSCSSARKYYLVNTGSVASDITFTEYTNDMEGGHGEHLRSIPAVLPGHAGRKALACSPASSATQACGVNYMWKIDGVMYSGSSVWNLGTAPKPGFWARLKAFFVGKKAEVDKVDAAAEPRLKALLGARSTPGSQDCVKICSAANGDANCLSADLNGGGADSQQGRDFVTPMLKLIRDAGDPGHVPVEKLLAALGQQGNPCERSGVSVNGGMLSNSGAACYYTAAKGTPFEVEFHLADTLSGRLSSIGGKMSLAFPNPNAFGARIAFANAGLQRDFGGEVWRADEISRTDAGRPAKFVVLTGPARCVALKVQ